MKLVLLFLVFVSGNSTQVLEILDGLDRVADFGVKFYKDLNFDGLLGFVMAEAQILQILPETTTRELETRLEKILLKLEKIRVRVGPLLPKSPQKMLILEQNLLNPKNWIFNLSFSQNGLQNLGLYNWKSDFILKDREASYKGVPSDFCLMEILWDNCSISPFCHEMMLAPRTDRGYLLSHRLFYLQIIRLKSCKYNSQQFRSLTRHFCSLMLKEARTNDFLGFPAHDIFLEQMVLCGLEGYSEFLTDKWRRKILNWMNSFGCFRNYKRTSNVIEFGCTDHSTGLGAAALAINLKFVLKIE